MDFRKPLVSDPKAAELVKPRDGSFHYPAINAKSASMLFTTAGDYRFNPFFPERVAMRFGIISAVRV
jgi:hypothetical protein